MSVRHLCAAVAVIATLLPVRAAAAADRVVFLVRHAEREAAPSGQPAAPPGQPAHGMMADDPPLNAAGLQRAARLAAMLAGSDIRYIFTTEFRRTRQTAEPLAKQLKLTPVMSAAKDPDPLIAQVKKAAGNVLIVAHANTLPDLLKKLGVTADVKIEDAEFDNLFIVVRHGAAPPTLVRLRY